MIRAQITATREVTRQRREQLETLGGLTARDSSLAHR